jgi:hypothetical protein
MNMRIARYLAIGLGLFLIAALARDASVDVARILSAISASLFSLAALAMVMAAWSARG